MLVSDLKHMSCWRGEKLENYVGSPFLYNFMKICDLWVLDAMGSHCLKW